MPHTGRNFPLGSAPEQRLVSAHTYISLDGVQVLTRSCSRLTFGIYLGSSRIPMGAEPWFHGSTALIILAFPHLNVSPKTCSVSVPG